MCQSTNSASENNALLDLFVKKGYVTQQEADQVEAEAQARQTNAASNSSPPPFTWTAIPGIKDMEIFGDVRLRYEDRSAEDPAGNQIDLQRWRYAVRFGVRGDLFDQFYYGLRFDTSPQARSSFVTLGSATSSSSTYNYAPFGKSEAGLNIGEVYLGWNPEPWVNLTVGKMPNPLYTTPMVWSSNITPEGFAERFKYPVGPAQFFANFGQFLYDDLNPDFASPGLGINGGLGQSTDNIFMFAWQGGVDYRITPRIEAKVAATLYNYMGLRSTTQNTFGSLAPYYGDTYIGQGAYPLLAGTGGVTAPGFSGFGTGLQFPGASSVNYPFNQVGLDDLQVIEVPFEFNVDIPKWKLETRLFGDFAYNLQGAQRAEAAAAAYDAIVAAKPFQGSPPPSLQTLTPQTSDVKAYQIGLGIGSDDVVYGQMQGLVFGTSAPRHAWEVRTYWQHIEQYSLDPNILDADFFNGLENLQGIYVAASYAFTGNLIGTFRYGHASRINNLLGTGGSSIDIPQINPVNTYNIYQADLTLIF